MTINYTPANFYSCPNKPELNKYEFLGAIILPYWIEILDLIFSTIGLIMGQADKFALDPTKYFYLIVGNKAFVGIISLLYGIWKYRENIFKKHIFYWICVTSLLPVIKLINSFYGEKIKFLDIGIGIFNLVMMMFIIRYLFWIDYSVINGWKRFFYDEGFYDANGKYFLTPNATISRKKVIFAFSKIFIFLIINTVILTIYGLITKKFIESSGEKISSKNNDAIKNSFKVHPIAIAISALIIAPIYEEIIFRNIIIKMGNYSYVSVFSSALIFGLIHLKQETFLTIFSYFVGGCIFAVLFKKYKNIWFTIFLHFLHNCLALFSLLIARQ